ncbi:unnamed protein product [Didymodactylos carnosus]|uniref:Uncharacterized protein n=1 Tax=Didymodactylos carnosus TaxID=1234261 RepID=A0A8S2DZB9_9BILA|nr:unnamed protein product [Didymodactylos carnosus]CAF3775247.1 unnamed protein product [Didymodactylos carnosus]
MGRSGANIRMSMDTNRKMITFNGIPNATTNCGGIPNGYEGFNWDNVGYINEYFARAQYKDCGFVNAFSNGGKYVAFNWAANPMLISSTNEHVFDVYSLVANAAHNDNLPLTITGLQRGNETYKKTVSLQLKEPQIIELNWPRIDTLHLQASGGSPHSEWFGLSQFILSCLNIGSFQTAS